MRSVFDVKVDLEAAERTFREIKTRVAALRKELDLASKAQPDAEADLSPVERFNAERNSRPDPFKRSTR